MFDFDASKLLIVGVIALIFIPSKDLPRVLRQVGQFVSKARRMASEFQGQFMDAMREADVADLKREAQKLAESARVDVGLDSITDLRSHVTRAIDGDQKPIELMGSDASATEAGVTGAMPATPTSVAPTAIAPTNRPPTTMDDAGMKDPNAELRRLTGTADPAPRPGSDQVPAAPVVHSAL